MITLFLLLKTQKYKSCSNFIGKRPSKSSKRLNKGSESSLCWNEYKTKSDNKNTTNKFRFCPESNFVGVNRLFVSVYSNQNTASRKFKTKRFYSPKGIIDNYNVIIHLKNFYDPGIALYIK